jgi:hypothetical protein
MTEAFGKSNGSELTAKHSTRQPDTRLPLHEELSRIAERFEAVDQRAKRATTIQDREAAERERLEAAGDYAAAEMAMADLLLMLVRLALRHQPDALAQYLARALRCELEPIADAIIRLESRR